MRTGFCCILMVAVALIGCKSNKKKAPDKVEARPAEKAPVPARKTPPPRKKRTEKKPVSVASYVKALQADDMKAALAVVNRLKADSEGWKSGQYKRLYLPIWKLYVRLKSKNAPEGGFQVASAIGQLFNRGNWYPLKDRFIAAIKNKTLPQQVRFHAIDHIWRFAGRESRGTGFKIPKADRPAIEAAVTACLGEKDLSILSTAVTTAGSLKMASALPRLKEIAKKYTANGFQVRSLRYQAGLAMFTLGAKKEALAVMKKLGETKGSYGNEAKKFVEKNQGK